LPMKALWLLSTVFFVMVFSPCCKKETCLAERLVDDYLQEKIAVMKERASIVSDNWDNCENVVIKLKKFTEDNKARLEKIEKSYDEMTARMCKKELEEFKGSIVKRLDSINIGLSSQEFFDTLHKKCPRKFDDIIKAMGYNASTWGPFVIGSEPNSEKR